jgi:50S ribosomal subunit-associated GTPase HflX
MGGRRGRGDKGGAERRGGGGRGAGSGHEERPNAGGTRGGGGEDEEGYRQRVNERFDRLAKRLERLEEEVRQLRGGGEGGDSRGA